MNKFLEIASSPLMNLDHTYRYSGTKLVEPESLSQHIIDTIMMGIKIIDEINSLSEEKLDISKYVMKAVYHDLEEVITGDVPRPLKYFNEDTKDSLKEVAEKVAYSLFADEFTTTDSHYSIWSNAKEDKEGYILKLVDTLVVANKVVKEVSLLNNYYMLRVAYEVSRYLREIAESLDKGDSCFESHVVDHYLLSILYGAISAMMEILGDNKKCIESLNIYKQSMI